MKKQILIIVGLIFSSNIYAQLGIGTTSPSEVLDVETSDATKTAVDINNTGGGDPKINFQLNGTSTFSIGIDNSDSDKLKIGTSAVETNTRLTIDASGNVGIGNSSPSAKIDVDGSAIFNESGAAVDFRVESDANTHMIYVDGTNNEMGINTSTPNSTFDIQGSLGYKLTTVTSATTLGQSHNIVLCNTGPYTITLPAAASNTGKVYYIKNIDTDGDDVTVDGNGAETIDGSATNVLDAYNDVIRIISDGSNWHIIETYPPPVEVILNCDGSTFTYNDVTNATTGKTWMDRNLGASQVATSSSDANAYGDLYQWGRAKDGHQCRTSGQTTTLSTTNSPGHANYIMNSAGTFNWMTSIDNNLWQGDGGTNDPCPSGYRLPTSAELEAERTSWSTNNANGAYASVLKFTVAGNRNCPNGSLINVGSQGRYWSSTNNGSNYMYFLWIQTTPQMYPYRRADGYSVRCIKN